MAHSLGVHRDGTNFGLGPVEIEVRRRLWAQLCVLDAQYAENLGREPTITLDGYDTALPLSIEDRDLTAVDEQPAASRQTNQSVFKTHTEMELEQERQSPFSRMTFSLVQAEIARLMSELMASRYRPRDAIFYTGSESPHAVKSARSDASLRSDLSKQQWVDRLEHRFRAVYALNGFAASDLMQSLVKELASISIMKAHFMNQIMTWKQGRSGITDRSMGSESLK